MAFFQSVGPYELLIILLLWALPIWAIVDMSRQPDQRWRAAGRSRVAWVLAVIFLGLLGALLYVIVARPQLRRSGTPSPPPPAPQFHP